MEFQTNQSHYRTLMDQNEKKQIQSIINYPESLKEKWKEEIRRCY